MCEKRRKGKEKKKKKKERKRKEVMKLWVEECTSDKHDSGRSTPREIGTVGCV